jgi:NAD(P)H-dependent FMN reductase
MTMIRVAIVTGSTRPGRKNEAVARWVYDIAKARRDAEVELVDIADYNLPLLDEAVPPSMGQYNHAHTKAWADKIGAFDAYLGEQRRRPLIALLQVAREPVG